MGSYDVIVIGARCAGAATAMLLARAGLHVLLVDRFDEDATRHFFLAMQGMVAPESFFNDENIDRLMSAARVS
jgi:flavin-dependent dehydrogenase